MGRKKRGDDFADLDEYDENGEVIVKEAKEVRLAMRSLPLRDAFDT